MLLREVAGCQTRRLSNMPEYKVLLVEDSPTMRQLIAFALKRLPGISIVEASDGVDGLKKLSAEKFDLIFTDINMPILDGLKLVSLIRNEPAYASIPVVVISTEGAKEDMERARLLGVNDYLTKPVQAQKIVEVATRMLSLA